MPQKVLLLIQVTAFFPIGINLGRWIYPLEIGDLSCIGVG
jgi:hypothetical protein